MIRHFGLGSAFKRTHCYQTFLYTMAIISPQISELPFYQIRKAWKHQVTSLGEVGWMDRGMG